MPILGTTQMARTLDKVGATRIRFAPDELAALNQAVRAINVCGALAQCRAGLLERRRAGQTALTPSLDTAAANATSRSNAVEYVYRSLEPSIAMRLDQLAAMRLFICIVETGSFAQAARSLGMSSSNATERIAKLEASLGVKLLARTTRALAPTPAGSRYFETCRRLLTELDEVESSLADAKGSLAGRVRVSANTAIARSILLPRLPAFIARYPEINVELLMSDRRGDFVRDGIDFAVRIGGLEDQDLIMRPLGRPRRMTVAAPGYLQTMGRPDMPRDLSGHRLIDFLLADPGDRLEWEFEKDGLVTAWRPHATTAVGDANARVDLAVAGLGVAQTLCFIAAPALRDRRLERLLPRWETDAPAVSILYPRDRHLPARTRATMDMFAEWITQALDDARPGPA